MIDHMISYDPYGMDDMVRSKRYRLYRMGNIIPGNTFAHYMFYLHNGVSKQTSAICPLLTCSSFGATGENFTRCFSSP